mmetsp:Transcript_19663/g.45862  ORF Transcript_19663/g.45862 Transcript_19663/m.45862 type:complete len:397 (-) Transcript_19663:2213-3403(-)
MSEVSRPGIVSDRNWMLSPAMIRVPVSAFGLSGGRERRSIVRNSANAVRELVGYFFSAAIIPRSSFSEGTHPPGNHRDLRGARESRDPPAGKQGQIYGIDAPSSGSKLCTATTPRKRRAFGVQHHPKREREPPPLLQGGPYRRGYPGRRGQDGGSELRRGRGRLGGKRREGPDRRRPRQLLEQRRPVALHDLVRPEAVEGIPDKRHRVGLLQDALLVVGRERRRLRVALLRGVLVDRHQLDQHVAPVGLDGRVTGVDHHRRKYRADPLLVVELAADGVVAHGALEDAGEQAHTVLLDPHRQPVPPHDRKDQPDPAVGGEDVGLPVRLLLVLRQERVDVQQQAESALADRFARFEVLVQGREHDEDVLLETELALQPPRRLRSHPAGDAGMAPHDAG